jgi:NAD(P)-dependent dehydrogenase (short-subunit alcohol dehydrogenase family)
VLTDMTRCFDESVIADICEETPLLRRERRGHRVRRPVSRFEDASFITGQVLCVDGGRCI